MSQILPPYTYIDTNEALRNLVAQVANEPLIAIDTESNSLYAYKEQVCLVQLSTREQDYIIDPLRIDDMQPMAQLFSDPNIECVLHAAEYDLMTLKRDYGFQMKNLFDTMIAARLAGHEAFGLAALLSEYFGVRANKKHQRDNWGKRPLSADSLQYAQMDTHYLPELRDDLAEMLQDMGRWEEALELFEEAVHVPAADNSFDPEGYWRIGRPSNLTSREMAILRQLYLLRETIAERENLPTFKVITNNAMVSIAQAEPRTVRQLSSVKGVSNGTSRRYGNQILDAIRQGRYDDLPSAPPLPTPPEPHVADRFVTLQQWRKEIAIQRGIGSDMVLSKEMLWRLARQVPQTVEEIVEISELGPKRAALYGERLQKLLSSMEEN